MNAELGLTKHSVKRGAKTLYSASALFDIEEVDASLNQRIFLVRLEEVETTQQIIDIPMRGRFFFALYLWKSCDNPTK